MKRKIIVTGRGDLRIDRNATKHQYALRKTQTGCRGRHPLR